MSSQIIKSSWESILRAFVSRQKRHVTKLRRALHTTGCQIRSVSLCQMRHHNPDWIIVLDYILHPCQFHRASSVNHAASGHDELFAFQLQFLNLLPSLPSADEAEIWEHPEGGPVRHEPRRPVTGAPLRWCLDTQEA